MKKKAILTIAFAASLLPMLLNQYGGRKGVQEITGLINLLNPIGILSVLLFAAGVWAPFKRQVISRVFGALGTIGIVISEVYQFLTWHVMTITGEISIQHSIRLAFPEFYMGLTVSFAMIIVYFAIDRKAGITTVVKTAENSGITTRTDQNPAHDQLTGRIFLLHEFSSNQTKAAA